MDILSPIKAIEYDLKTKFYYKNNVETIWTIDDIVYSHKSKRWCYKTSYYNDSIDSGRLSRDVDAFEESVKKGQIIIKQ